MYHYPPQPSPNTDPNWPVPDYNATSSVANLGAVWYTVNPFVPSQRPQYTAAVAAKGAFAWSPVYQLAQATNSTTSVQQNQSLIAASKAFLTADGSVGYVCFASVFLSRLGDLLRSLSVSYGANGLALITDRHGVPLASSDNSLMLYTSRRPTWSLSQFSDQRLQAIAAPLANNNVFLSANATPPNSPTGDFQFGGVFLSERARIRRSADQLRGQRISPAGNCTQQYGTGLDHCSGHQGHGLRWRHLAPRASRRSDTTQHNTTQHNITPVTH